MGLDFINRAKGSIRKSREKHKALLATELVPYVEEITTLLVKNSADFCFSEEQMFELQVTDQGIDVFHERKLVGQSDSVSPSVTAEIERNGGKALGRLKRIRPHSGRADLTVLVNRERSDETEH